MRYTLQIKQPLRFSVGDRFDVQGRIFGTDIQGVETAAQPLGVTGRMTKGAGSLFTESLAVLGADGVFTWTAPNALVENASGKFFAAIFEDSGARATIDVGVDGVVGSVVVTPTAGNIPPSGFYAMEGEWGEYTYNPSTNTVTFVSRGEFSTSAAAHAINTVIAFAAIKETAQPHFQYSIVRDENA